MPKAKPLTITTVMNDPALFGKWFAGASWDNWRIFLKVLFGLPLAGSELQAFQKFTQRQNAPQKVNEAWLVVGRRGGKSLIAAFVAVFLACFRDYTEHLAPGEHATIMIVAADRRQARVVFRYIAGFLESIPMLGRLVLRKTQDSIDLSNRVTIEVHTASFRSTRGYSITAAICDGIAYWRSEESANPDTEILNSLRPGMATMPGSLLLCISSPYARRGEMWKAYRQFFAKEVDGVLVWQADTRSMNPTIPEKVVQEATEKDASAASAEYLAQFRRDIETLVTQEAVDAVVMPGRRELPAIDNVGYFAFVDPSGGSQDSMTLAIAHREEHKVILDLVLERYAPFSPESVTKEFAQVLRQYRITIVTGDRYAGEWCQEAFRKCGFTYRVSDKSKGDLYLNLLPLINSGKVELLDNTRLINQLINLERRTSRSGKDTIDHAPGTQDDVINAAAGAIVVAAQVRERRLTWGRGNDIVRPDISKARPYPAPGVVLKQ